MASANRRAQIRAAKRKLLADEERKRLRLAGGRGQARKHVPGRVRFAPVGVQRGDWRVPLHPFEDALILERQSIACGDPGPLWDDEPVAPGRAGPSAAYPPYGYLWVYEPPDLEELTLDEVRLVWERRDQLCGSREAAAEALALIEVMDGVVDTYQGWQPYLEREEIRSLAPCVEPLAELTEEVVSPAPDPVALTRQDADIAEADEELAFPPLRRLDLDELSMEELQDAWDRRPESFVSLEAASEALGRLRRDAGIPGDHRWQTLMAHSEVLKLADDLPDHDADEAEPPGLAPAPASASPPSGIIGVTTDLSPDALRHDQRARRQQDIVVREGQAAFRQAVLDNYGGRCCVTGCRERLVLEAAHISPYSGRLSNHPSNGLCLRVDIHRLFDGFLISIDPSSRRLVIAPALTQDPTYGRLAGQPLSDGRVPAGSELLAEHYQRFLDQHPRPIGAYHTEEA